MYCNLLKIQVPAGQEAQVEGQLKKYLKAAQLNPGFIHGSFFVPEAQPDGSTPGGFGIVNRKLTYFIYLVFKTSRDMLKHVELYHTDDLHLLPSPYDYVLGSYVEDPNVQIENRYSS